MRASAKGLRPGGITIVCIAVCLMAATAHGREIADMAGRKVILPDKINGVCADWSPIMYMLYALDPSLLSALSVPFKGEQKSYVRPDVLKLPVVRGFLGGGTAANFESLLRVRPDAVIAEIPENAGFNAKSEEMLARMRVPIVYVKIDRSEDYPGAFEFLGSVLGREKRSRELAAYGRKALKGVKDLVTAIPASKRPRVYYAEGASGLYTECDTSFHAELIALAGATNVHHCPYGKYKVRGMEPVSVEQVMFYDPDVIIATDSIFFNAVFKDVRWRNLRAVRAGKVYLTPRILFDWFDHPPSFMRLLGIKWLAWRLYGGSCKIDMVREAQSFYRLFLGIDLPAGVIGKELEP